MIRNRRRGYGMFAVFILLTLLAIAGLMQNTQVVVGVLVAQTKTWTRIHKEDHLSRGTSNPEPISAGAEAPDR